MRREDTAGSKNREREREREKGVGGSAWTTVFKKSN